jgi:hypothetical protein
MERELENSTKWEVEHYTLTRERKNLIEFGAGNFKMVKEEEYDKDEYIILCLIMSLVL